MPLQETVRMAPRNPTALPHLTGGAACGVEAVWSRQSVLVREKVFYVCGVEVHGVLYSPATWTWTQLRPPVPIQNQLTNLREGKEFAYRLIKLRLTGVPRLCECVIYESSLRRPRLQHAAHPRHMARVQRSRTQTLTSCEQQQIDYVWWRGVGLRRTPHKLSL